MRRLVTKLLLDSKQGEETQARGRAREIIVFLREAKQIFRVKNLGILEMRLGKLKYEDKKNLIVYSIHCYVINILLEFRVI